MPESLFHLCVRPATLFKKEALAQVFSCEFYEIYTFYYGTPLVAASIRTNFVKFLEVILNEHFTWKNHIEVIENKNFYK